jgi:hypothetical protein
VNDSFASLDGAGDEGAENRFVNDSFASLDGAGDEGAENRFVDESFTSSGGEGDGGEEKRPSDDSFASSDRQGDDDVAVCLKIDREKSPAMTGKALPDDACRGVDGRGVKV